MIRLSTPLAAACATALLLAGAAAPASAAYLGYGNGDPGNRDFWTEQNGGKAVDIPTHGHATHGPVHYGSAHSHRRAAPLHPTVHPSGKTY